MNPPDKSAPLQVHFIAFKITGEPWRDLLTPQHQQSLSLALAFVRLLDWKIRAELGTNCAELLGTAARIVPVPSGFCGLFSVFDLVAGCVTLEKLFASLKLSAICTMAVRPYGAPVYHHVSGPDKGPFERHLAELSATRQSIAAVVHPPIP